MNHREIAIVVSNDLSLSSDNASIAELEISVGIVERVPDISAEDMHATFVAQRITEGFVPVEDPEDAHYRRPVRSSLIPWDDLPQGKQEKAARILESIKGGLFGDLCRLPFEAQT